MVIVSRMGETLSVFSPYPEISIENELMMAVNQKSRNILSTPLYLSQNQSLH
jgi:hypothetical protein